MESQTFEQPPQTASAPQQSRPQSNVNDVGLNLNTSRMSRASGMERPRSPFLLITFFFGFVSYFFFSFWEVGDLQVSLF